MDETTGLVYLGCNLAKDLEANMPNLANQPDLLSSKCEEIIRVFSSVKERLSHGGQMILSDQEAAVEQNVVNVGGQLQEWLRSSRSNAMELFHAQTFGERHSLNVHGLAESKTEGSDREEAVAVAAAAGRSLEVMAREMGGRDLGGSALFPAPMDVGDSSGGLSLQRQRRRKDNPDKKTITVPAPRMGNTEIPPEDGYTWRKYGQKEILGKRYPRAYYRCTHQKLYHCPAKKQVQRLDDDPHTFEVTYRGEHTCHMSSTAPSIPPPSSLPAPTSQEMINIHHHHHHQQDPSILSHWLRMNIKPPEEEAAATSGIIPMHMHMRDFSQIGGAGSNTSAGATAGPSSSTARYEGRDVEYQPVEEMARFVFNSGSSSNNSMDLIFSSMEDQKWDAPGKQN